MKELLRRFRNRRCYKIKYPVVLIMPLVLCCFSLSSFAADDHYMAPDALHAATTTNGDHSDAHQAQDGHHEHGDHGDHSDHGSHKNPEGYVIPPYFAVVPFALLLLCIAVLPLMHATEHWWENNWNRLLISGILGFLVLFFYGFIHPGVIDHHTHELVSGVGAVLAILDHAILVEYIPFIVLLFSLYVISGGINLKGDLPAHPLTNTLFLTIGAAIASFVGTTGAAMLLIRPLLQTNSERKYVKHTVIFFIFIVCNVGGCLLPVGDPPLFLGYLLGVPFMWTMTLWPYWLSMSVALLIIYYIWDTIVYKKENIKDIKRDEKEVTKLQLTGKFNFLLLMGVVLSVAYIVPGKTLFEIEGGWMVPDFFREGVQLVFVTLSLVWTKVSIRKANKFSYYAIAEVAALFIGIFICMQVPVEILVQMGSELGVTTGSQFFWFTGILSSFLDNAPTYVVFFKTAASPEMIGNATGVAGEVGITEGVLVGISLGAVFMGANSYIGNGPNFMVKSIAEESGVKMPSFFGYMLYSCAILIPLFIVLTFVMKMVGKW